MRPLLLCLLLGCASPVGARLGPSAGGDAWAGPGATGATGAMEATAPAAVEPGQTWTRRELVRGVVRRDPGLRALSRRARARVAEATAAAALPAPMAMAQLWQAPLVPPFVYGEGSMLMLGVQQTFPPGGARRAEAQGAEEEARMLSAELAVRERMLAAQVSMALADLREATARLALHASHRKLLEQVSAAARARQTTGSALLDLTRSERELAALIEDEEMSRGEERRARSELNVWLGLPPDAPLALAPGEPPGVPAAPVAALQAQARERSPELVASAAIVRRDVARAEAADRMASSPMYTVGVNYGLMGPHGPSNHTWGATFSMSLPWLSKGAAAMREARVEEREASRLDVETIRQRLDREVAAAHARAQSAARRLVVIDERLLPATRRSLDAARAGFATGATDTLGWLEAVHEIREVELSRIRAQGDLERALTELERAVGDDIPLTEVPRSSHDGGGHDHG